MANERVRMRAEKRGGGREVLPLTLNMQEGERRYVREPSTDRTPESVYEQRWALALMHNAWVRLRDRYDSKGRPQLFEALEGFLPGGRRSCSYREAASRLEMSLDQVKGRIHRLREQYGDQLRAEVAHTVSRLEDVDGEIRYLIEVLGGGS